MFLRSSSAALKMRITASDIRRNSLTGTNSVSSSASLAIVERPPPTITRKPRTSSPSISRTSAKKARSWIAAIAESVLRPVK